MKKKKTGEPEKILKYRKRVREPEKHHWYFSPSPDLITKAAIVARYHSIGLDTPPLAQYRGRRKRAYVPYQDRCIVEATS